MKKQCVGLLLLAAVGTSGGAAEKVAEWLHAVPWEAVASLASDLVPHIVELLIWIFLLL